MKKHFLIITVLIAILLVSVSQASESGKIVVWGNNTYGQHNIPFPNNGFIDVAAGQWYSLGLKQDGSVVAWGDNSWGQCNVPSPNTGFVAISAGYYHALGLKANGSIVAWGKNEYGQCNIPSPNSGFIAISAGGHHSLGLKQNGSVVAWGRNTYGECNVPAPNSDFIAVSAGYAFCLGLKQNGSVVAWQGNANGECNIPLPNTGFVAIAAGGWHAVGLRQNGSVAAWGLNDNGQCNVPSPNSGFVSIAAGQYHSLGIKQGSSIVNWGRNVDGQCNIPSPNNGFITVAAGQLHSLAIRNNPPLADPGQDQTIDAQAVWGAPVHLDGSNSSDTDSTPGTNDDIVSFNWYKQVNVADPNTNVFLGSGQTLDCNLPVGIHTIVLEVTDKAGASDTNDVIITIQDITPPQFTLSVEPNTLWPPNKAMVKITPSWTVSDLCDPDPNISLVDIQASEPADGDIRIDPDGSIYLRAWRSGGVDSRIYTITFQAVDDSGNSTESSAIVIVPHDQRSPK